MIYQLTRRGFAACALCAVTGFLATAVKPGWGVAIASGNRPMMRSISRAPAEIGFCFAAHRAPRSSESSRT